MVILPALILLTVSYVVAFKEDLPSPLIERTLIFVSILVIVQNHRIIINSVKELIESMVKVGVF